MINDTIKHSLLANLAKQKGGHSLLIVCHAYI